MAELRFGKTEQPLQALLTTRRALDSSNESDANIRASEFDLDQRQKLESERSGVDRALGTSAFEQARGPQESAIRRLGSTPGGGQAGFALAREQQARDEEFENKAIEAAARGDDQGYQTFRSQLAQPPIPAALEQDVAARATYARAAAIAKEVYGSDPQKAQQFIVLSLSNPNMAQVFEQVGAPADKPNLSTIELVQGAEAVLGILDRNTGEISVPTGQTGQPFQTSAGATNDLARRQGEFNLARGEVNAPIATAQAGANLAATQQSTGQRGELFPSALAGAEAGVQSQQFANQQAQEGANRAALEREQQEVISMALGQEAAAATPAGPLQSSIRRLGSLPGGGEQAFELFQGQVAPPDTGDLPAKARMVQFYQRVFPGISVQQAVELANRAASTPAFLDADKARRKRVSDLSRQFGAQPDDPKINAAGDAEFERVMTLHRENNPMLQQFEQDVLNQQPQVGSQTEIGRDFLPAPGLQTEVRQQVTQPEVTQPQAPAAPEPVRRGRFIPGQGIQF